MSEREKLLSSAGQLPLLDEEAIGGTSGSFIDCIRWWLEHGAGITEIKLPRSAKGPSRAWAVALSVTGMTSGEACGGHHGEEEPCAVARGRKQTAKASSSSKASSKAKQKGRVEGREASSLRAAYLFIYEEMVTEKTSTCDQCRIIGWGSHPVSLVRYQFIIPAETGPDSLDDPTSLVALTDAARRGVHPGTSFSMPSKPSMEGVSSSSSSSSYGAQSTIFDSKKHRLHGVIHGNGYGHLLRVNGLYGGSSRMTGLQIFALWDALCDRLGARGVTVEDVSSKSGMELRIAYLLAYGCTWYGLLGYTFGRGPYNITEKRWLEAGAYVSSVNLSQLMYDFRGVEDRVVAVIQRYCLPVPGAVEVRDFGALMYRLMYLQLNPLQAGPFFDETCIDQARALCGKPLVGELPVKRTKAQVVALGKKNKAEGGGASRDGASRDGRGNGSQDVKGDIPVGKVAKGNKAGKGGSVSKKKVVAAKTSGRRTRGDDSGGSLKDHQIGMLRFKVSVGDQYMDRARMLLLCIRSLIPCSRDVLDDAVATEEELDAMLSNLVEGDGAPVVTFDETWFEFLPEMLRWAQKLLGFRGVDAGAAIKITGNQRDAVEIDKEFLHRIKMYPETWVLPLEKVTILEYNGVEHDGVKITGEVRNPGEPIGLHGFDQGGSRNPSTGVRHSGRHKDVQGGGDVARMNQQGKAKPPRATKTKATGDMAGPGKARPGLKVEGSVKKEEMWSEHDVDMCAGVEGDGGGEQRNETAVPTSAPKLGVRERQSGYAGGALRVPTTIEEFIRISVDATVDGLWRSAVCPSEDDDAPMVHRPWHDLEPGSAVDDPTDPVKLRNQVTADLHLLFMCTLKLYVPEVAKIAGQNAAVELGQKHVAKIVKGKQISKEVGVLRDTKHFCKTYRSSEMKTIIQEMREPRVHSQIKPGMIRVRTTLVMPEELTSPDTSTRAGKKAMLPVQPPAEIIDMPGSSSVGDYLHVVTKRFEDIYALCKRFKAVGAYISAEREDNPKHPMMKKQTTIKDVFFSENTKLKSLVVPTAGKATGKRQAVLAMDVVGSFGNEVKIDWMLHAGGAQDWTVNCPCGTIDDDGAEMVACTKCETWFHTRCVKPDVPDTSWAKAYTCNRCLGIQQLKSPRY